MAEENENEIDLDVALKYFVDFKETPDYTYFEHTYSQPGHKKYYNGYVNPAKYLFTNPVPNIADSSPNSEFVDVETLDHDSPLFFNSEKINEQINDKSEGIGYDENWAEKIDRKEWNIIKLRLFKSAVQILEADYLSRLARKGLRDEAVKRHLMIKKTASRLKSLFGSVAWDPHSCQWLHTLLLEKLPSCYMKVYSDAFQRLEAKVPSHFLEHMTISTSYMSVRSRLLGEASQNNANKKSWDIFSSSLALNKPKKIIGEPLLVVVPLNMGNNFTPNSRMFRFISEFSSLGTLITVAVPKGSPEIPTLLEQMIQATVSKIIELQTEHPSKPIVLIGFGAESLLACHIALGFGQKITAVVCVGFHLFTMEGKIGKANNKILGLKTPVLFCIGQNATAVTVDEMEDFRLRLRCKSSLIVVGGADDYLRVNNFLKMKCSITQNIVDRCIINEISDFLNDIMQPTKVLLSLLSNNDAISAQGKPAVSPGDAQLLKTLLSESVNKPDSPIIKKLTKTLAQLTSDPEFGTTLNEQSTKPNKNTESSSLNVRKNPKEPNKDNGTRKRPFSSSGEPMTLKKVLTSSDSTIYRYTHLSRRSEENKRYSSGQNRISTILNSANKFSGESKFSIHSTLAPVNFARKTRGGRRPYVRRTIPPQRKMMVTPSFAPAQFQESREKSRIIDVSTSAVIENLTPDSLLHMPVIFADENDEENVINDVSLASYLP